MEFASLVGPGGALWRAWVAAHWEKRLKRHDYLAADVRAIAALVVERLRTIPLRCVGRLLLGACRILRWKVQQLEEEAEDVRAGLLVASSGPSLPSVASLPESALTLKLQPGEVSWWGSDLEFGVGEQLQLLEEPEVPLLEVRASLEEGRRHVAPLETITLGPDVRAQAPQTLEGPADAFGIPTAEDRAAMDLLSRGPVGSEGHGEAPPPLDFLLGHSGASAARPGLSLGSGDVVSGAGFLGDLGRVPMGLPGEAPLLDALEGDEGLESATPRGLVKRLEEEFLTPRFAGDEHRFARGSTQSSYLARMLEFSPDGGQAVPDDFYGGPGAARAAGPPSMPTFPLVPGFAEAPAEAEDVAAAVVQPVQTPRKVRRKRFKQWLDEHTEIPKAEYHDTASITREPLCDYRLFLPHRAPHVGLTTVLADICPLLCEPFLQAPLVGAKRRRALTESASRPVLAGAPVASSGSTAAPAPAPAAAGVAEAVAPEPPLGASQEAAAAAELPSSGAALEGELDEIMPMPLVEGLASLPPSPLLEEEEEPVPLVPPWDGGDLHTPRSERCDESALASPRSAASPHLFGRGEDEEEEGLEGPEDVPEAGGSPLPYAPLSPLDEQAGDEDRGGAGFDLPEGLDVPIGAETPVDVPRSPAAGGEAGYGALAEFGPVPGEGMDLGAPPLGVAEEPATLVRPEDAERPSKVRRTEGASAEPAAQQPSDVQASHLQSLLGTLDTDVSLLDLCEASNWGAEDAAQSFMGLLALHMEGAVSLTQAEPYGDIVVGRGPDWPAPAAVLADA